MKKWVFTVVCLFTILLSSCGIDFHKEDIKKMNISGIVIHKYKDEWNHEAPTIICKNGRFNFEYQLSSWTEVGDLWDFIEINDSISKPPGSLILKVFKPDGRVKEYQYRP